MTDLDRFVFVMRHIVGGRLTAKQLTGKAEATHEVRHPELPETSLLTPEQFRGTPEFRQFKGIMRRLLKVPKSDLNEMVKVAKETSPRFGNPNAAGPKTIQIEMRMLITALFVALALSAQSQPPTPAPAFKGSPQKEPSKGRAEQTTSYNHGAEDSPVFVKVIPTPKSQEETADDKAKYRDQSAANWWMVRLTLAVVFIGVIQTAVFALQARRLKQTVDKMDAIAAAQTADIQASINQATRAATAMEQIAISLNTQVGHMRTGLDLTRQSADAATQSAETAKRALVATQRALIVNAEINAGVVVDDISRQLVGFHFFCGLQEFWP